MRTRKFLMEYFSCYYSCFDTSRQVEKDVFPLVTSVGQRKNSESQLRNRTTDLRIPHSAVVTLSRIDSMVSEAHYEVHK